MTTILAIPMMSSAFPNAEVTVIPDFSLMISPWGLYHSFKKRETTMIVYRHKVLEVNSLVFDIVGTAILI